MRRRSCIHVKAACALAFASALHITSALATADSGATISGSDSDVIEDILKCITAGEEAVLLREGVECKNYREGAKYLARKTPDMPLKIDADQICTESEDRPKDGRRLSGNAIKKIVALAKSSADPRGLRIIGAAFCEQLDLAGVSLPYSLVIDRSLFRKGFEARNFRISGDLSFDGSLALDEVTITRSHIDGTVFASNAYVKNLRVLDSQVQGSLIFRESTIPELAIFDTVSLSGELSLRGTALSYFLLQFSKVGGVLDLTDSQARCAYQISKSEIGDLVAVNAGFGTSTTVQTAGQDKASRTLFDWRPKPNSTYPPNNRECSRWNIAVNRTFLVSDTRVRASLCFRSFHWLVPTIGPQIASFVTLNDVNVNATSFIDLAPANAASIGPDGERKFEAIGLKTHSLMFNFDAGAQMRGMSVGGLAFEQAYTAAGVTCAYDPDYYKEPPSGAIEARLENVGERSHWRLPRVPEIMSWLDNNCLQTTQPLSAFVDAAKKAGDVADATELQIARETQELQLRIQRVFGSKRNSNCEDSPKVTAAAVDSVSDGVSFVSNAVSFVSDAAAVLFGSFLWLVADHGYRPQKVFWFVAAALIGAVAYFWLWEKVVGFMPANKNAIRPISLPFLFDRLLPWYKISEEHYDVDSYYKRVSKPLKTDGSDKVPVTYMNLFWFKIPVVKADEGDIIRIRKCLEVMKWTGLLLALFLVAAVKALFDH